MPREKMVQCKNEDIYNKKIPRGKKKIITIQKTYKKKPYKINTFPGQPHRKLDILAISKGYQNKAGNRMVLK